MFQTTFFSFSLSLFYNSFLIILTLCTKQGWPAFQKEGKKMEYQFKDLVNAGKQENNHAREQLIDKLHPLIYSLIRRYGPAKPCDREDLYQEAVETILHCIREYDENRNVPFLSYVKRSLIYCVRNGSRETKMSRESHSLDKCLPNSEFTLLDCLEDSSLSAADLLEQEELQETVKIALQQLDPALRKILILYYYDGCSLKDIALSRNIHYQTVKMAKKRALGYLKKYLYRYVRKEL